MVQIDPWSNPTQKDKAALVVVAVIHMDFKLKLYESFLTHSYLPSQKRKEVQHKHA